MPAYSLVIFDFDGTLADSFPWFLSVLDRTANEFGLRHVAPEEIPALRDMSSRDALTRLGVPLLKLPAISVFMRGLAKDAAGSIPLFDGAGAMLGQLRDAGVALSLVSSNAELVVRAVLGPAAALIDRYDCGSALFGKPAKLKAMAAGRAAGSVISIGDEVRDIEAARKAKVAAGAVTFGYNSRRALERAGPDALFDSYGELLQLVLGRSGST